METSTCQKCFNFYPFPGRYFRHIRSVSAGLCGFCYDRPSLGWRPACHCSYSTHITGGQALGAGPSLLRVQFGPYCIGNLRLWNGKKESFLQVSLNQLFHISGINSCRFKLNQTRLRSNYVVVKLRVSVFLYQMKTCKKRGITLLWRKI